MWRATALALSVLAANFIPGGPAAAPQAEIPHVILAAQGLWSLERVYAKLRKHYSGEALDAQLVRNPPDVVLYEVQWLTRDGRKVVFIVDAHDGNIVGARGLENDANPGR